MKYESTCTKSGSNRTFNIVNGAELITSMPASAAKFIQDNGDLRVMCSNKREAAAVELALKIANEPAVAITPVATKPQSRTIMLLSRAEADGLNHGKSWRCSGMNVDAHSLPPHWEGELICYVYAE